MYKNSYDDKITVSVLNTQPVEYCCDTGYQHVDKCYVKRRRNNLKEKSLSLIIATDGLKQLHNAKKGDRLLLAPSKDSGFQQPD